MTTDFLNYSKWLKVRMDESTTKCEENARYSFLLGSALRNEDTEQFLQIYDAIIPTEISPEQVDRIKEEARRIADIEEGEFNGLVSQARHFSVAAPVVVGRHHQPMPSTGTTSTSTPGDELLKGRVMDDKVARTGLHQVKRSPGGGGGAGGAYTTANNTWKTTNASSTAAAGAGHDGVNDVENTLEDYDDHGDSGVFNVSKNTVGSASDYTDLDELGVAYFPSDSTTNSYPTEQILMNKELQRKNNAAYDAELIADDSDADEPNNSRDVEELVEVITEKPRDIEMKPLGNYHPVERDHHHKSLYVQMENENTRRRNDLQFDEVCSVGSSHDDTPDDDDPNVRHYTTHEQLYGKGQGRYTQMRREFEDETYGETGQVYKSDGVSIQREVRHRGGGSKYSQPYYGDPPNVGKILVDSSRLVDLRETPDVCDTMPPGKRIDFSLNSRDSEGSNTDNAAKKKKKKKKITKDDSGGDYDENGNPMEDRRTHPEFKTLGPSSIRSRTTCVPKQAEDFNHFEYNGKYVGDMDDQNSSSTSVSDQPKKKTRVTRRKENDLATSIKAENIVGHQGEKTVEELLGFIDNNSNSSSNYSSNSGTKKKKKLSGNQLLNGSAEGSLTNGPVLAEASVNKTVNKKVKPSNKTKASSLPKDFEKSSIALCDPVEDIILQKAEEAKVAEYPIAESKSVPVPQQQQPPKKTEPVKAVNTKANPENYVEDIVDNYKFKFTDFENMFPPREEEFKLVTRKKPTRTTTTMLPQVGSTSSSHSGKDYPSSKDNLHSSYDNAYNATYGVHSIQNSSDNSSSTDFMRSRDDRVLREERSSSHRKSRPIVRSITPPPSTFSHSSSDEYYPEKTPVLERAFSPSAFPALGGMREGRRNSTGNAPSESTPDDSDIESVKSLPLVAAAVPGATSTSKVEGVNSPIVSYAKIAAGPKNAGKAAANPANINVSGLVTVGKEDKVCESGPEPDVELPGKNSVELPGKNSAPALADTLVNDVEPKQGPRANTNGPRRKTKSVSEDTTPKPKSSPVDKMMTNEPKENVTESTNHIQTTSTSVKPTELAISNVVNIEGSIRKNSKVEPATVKSVHSGYSPQMPYCDNKLHQTITFGSSAILNIDEPVKPAALPAGTPPILNINDFPSISEIHAAKNNAHATAAVVAAAAPSLASPVAVVSQGGRSQPPPPPVVASTQAAQPRARHHSNPQAQPSAGSQATVSTLPTQSNTSSSSSSPKTTVVNNKKQKNKSVVFLDNKRSRPSPQNLGISFGFPTNPNLAGVSDMPVAKAPVAQPEPVAKADPKLYNHGLNGIVPELYDKVNSQQEEEKSTQNVIKAGVESPSPHHPSSAPRPTDSPTVIADTNKTLQTTINYKPGPQQPPYTTTTPTTTSPNISGAVDITHQKVCPAASSQCGSVLDDAAIAAISQVPPPGCKSGGVVVLATATISTTATAPAGNKRVVPGQPRAAAAAAAADNNNKRLINLQNLMPPDRALDPNYARGRFTVEDAVMLMKTEWDHVMDMKNKDPARVLYYSSQ